MNNLSLILIGIARRRGREEKEGGSSRAEAEVNEQLIEILGKLSNFDVVAG